MKNEKNKSLSDLSINEFSDLIRHELSVALKIHDQQKENDETVETKSLLTASQLAKKLNYTAAHVRQLRREGKIPFVGDVSHRYDFEDVLFALKNQKQ
jgi:hypothetical protein